MFLILKTNLSITKNMYLYISAIVLVLQNAEIKNIDRNIHKLYYFWISMNFTVRSASKLLFLNDNNVKEQQKSEILK